MTPLGAAAVLAIHTEVDASLSHPSRGKADIAFIFEVGRETQARLPIG